MHIDHQLKAEAARRAGGNDAATREPGHILQATHRLHEMNGWANELVRVLETAGTRLLGGEHETLVEQENSLAKDVPEVGLLSGNLDIMEVRLKRALSAALLLEARL